MSFRDEIKYSLKYNNNFSIILYFNLFVFVVVKIIEVVSFFVGEKTISLINWLAIPANSNLFINRPWTVLTYMFTHENFLHILFNLLAFYWFSKLFLMYYSQRQLLGVYILGGIAGAVFYFSAFNLIPVFAKYSELSIALGASASVMAIVFSVALLVPNQEVYLLFFGQVKLKFLAITFIILDIISIPISNAGGHIAHIGGAIMGGVYVYFYRKGTDFTIGLSRLIYGIKKIFENRKNHKIKYNSKKSAEARFETDMEYNARKKAEQDEIDRILEKISRSGYSSLNAEEKEKLFKMSNRR